MNGVEDGTGVFEWAALATSGSTSANPASVEKPGVGLVLCDLVCQHPGITHGVQGEEWLRKAGRESRLWFCDAVFGSSHFRRVSRNEVIHGLFSIQLRDRWQDTSSIASQQNNVCGMARADARNFGVLNILDRIGTDANVNPSSNIK